MHAHSKNSRPRFLPATDGVFSKMSREEFGHLVHAVSDALIHTPDIQVQSYIRDCQLYHSKYVRFEISLHPFKPHS